MWIEVRESGTNRLLFRYDPRGRRVEVRRRQICTIVALNALDDAAA